MKGFVRVVSALVVLASSSGVLTPNVRADMVAELPSEPSQPESEATLAGAAAQQVGFAVGSGIFLSEQPELDSDLDGIAEIGASWIRVDVTWAWIESQRDHYDWADLDRVIDGATDRGLSIVGVLGYSPAWARPEATNDKAPPDNPDDFASFAAIAAQRYAAKGVFTWEIWNEPNLSAFWQPVPDSARYSELLVAASEAIRSAVAETTVLSGGLAPATDDLHGQSIAPATFLRGIYEAGGGRSFDAIAAHPYSYPLLATEAAAWNAFTQLPELHEIATSWGDAAKLIWLTEYGAPTGPEALHARGLAVNEHRQATMLISALDAVRAMPWVGPVFLYNYRDAPDAPNDRESYFGVIRSDGSAKPSWDAVRKRLNNPGLTHANGQRLR